jgi:hypothetical protein
LKKGNKIGYFRPLAGGGECETKERQGKFGVTKKKEERK